MTFLNQREVKGANGMCGEGEAAKRQRQKRRSLLCGDAQRHRYDDCQPETISQRLTAHSSTERLALTLPGKTPEWRYKSTVK